MVEHGKKVVNTRNAQCTIVTHSDGTCPWNPLESMKKREEESKCHGSRFVDRNKKQQFVTTYPIAS